jgi:iron complex transport system substrate-binding protein
MPAIISRTAAAVGRAALVALALGAAPARAGPPARIADLWYAHNATTVMLGAADRVAVTVDSPQAQPWLYRVAPALRRAAVVSTEAANAETLLAAGVGMAFVSQPAEADRLTRLGVPARALAFTDVASMRVSLRATAEAIDTPVARGRVRDYEAYLDGVLARLAKGLQGVPPAARPRVLHIASTTPLRADGAGSIVDEWITLAGGRNAAVGLKGSLQPVSVEQIAQWNPDIIIVGGQDARPDDDPLATIPGLRGRRMVRNPSGVYQWDRYGPEFALQVQWAAKLLHPQPFAALDMNRETVAFFHRFFAYPLTASEAALILDAQPPTQGPAR